MDGVAIVLATALDMEMHAASKASVAGSGSSKLGSGSRPLGARVASTGVSKLKTGPAGTWLRV